VLVTTVTAGHCQTMGTIARLSTWLMVIFSLATVVHGHAGTDAPDALMREAVEELKQLYATDITLGTPLEIEGFKIIPLATVGVGLGHRTGAPEREAFWGAGGVLSPVGVIVVSTQGVQLLPVSKGFVAQVLSAVTPMILQVIQATRKAPADSTSAPPPRVSMPAILATLYAFIPEGGLKFGVFPWPLPLVLIFVAGWLVLALLIAVFLPRQLAAVAATLQANVPRAGVVGLLSYGAVFMLAAVFTISIIGIPFAVLVLVFTWTAKLLGTVSIAWLIGQRVAAAVRRTPSAEVVSVLIGGIMLGVVRIIPVLGWCLWAIVGIFGFGAVLRTHMPR
jgi:uncharacterized spore protein YtfJ